MFVQPIKLGVVLVPLEATGIRGNAHFHTEADFLTRSHSLAEWMDYNGWLTCIDKNYWGGDNYQQQLHNKHQQINRTFSKTKYLNSAEQEKLYTNEFGIYI